jgi:hypothetical protein
MRDLSVGSMTDTGTVAASTATAISTSIIMAL